MRHAPVRTRSKLGARTRITLVVTLAFTVGAAALSIVLVSLLHSQLIGNIDQANDRRAQDIASLLSSGATSGRPGGIQIPATQGDSDLVQVIGPDGTVIAATNNLGGEAALPYDATSPITVTDLPIGTQSAPYRMTSITQTGPDGTVRTVVVGRSLETIEHAIGSLAVSLIIGVPVLTGLVAALSWAAVARSLRPVEAIRVEFSQITTTDLHRRVPHPHTPDELGALADTLNVTLGRLEHDVTAQQRFVADAAHELRSPLAALSAQLELARTHTTNLGDATTVALLKQSRRLERLVDDLLALARHDGGGSDDVHRRLVDLDGLVLEETMRARLISPVPIETSDVSSAQVRGDPDSLARLIRNLVDNAARHASSRVTLSLHERNASAVLIVDDDGPGIPVEDRERIFERFTRLDEARDRRTGGTGLGLAISGGIVRRHGGSIVVGDSPSGGARFTVSLPAAASDAT